MKPTTIRLRNTLPVACTAVLLGACSSLCAAPPTGSATVVAPASQVEPTPPAPEADRLSRLPQPANGAHQGVGS
ncbi:MAG: hypothetical protein AAF184_14360 [Pseudomonadota bacterium]